MMLGGLLKIVHKMIGSIDCIDNLRGLLTQFNGMNHNSLEPDTTHCLKQLATGFDIFS